MSIEGKVAAILNEREVIFNKGSESGVEEGMTFRVTTPDLPVRDPDTHEELGTFNQDKIGIKVTEVQPKFSVGRTYETYMVKSNIDLVTESVQKAMRSLHPSEDVRQVRTLRIGGGSTLTPLTEEDSIVKVGDKVVQVVDAKDSVHSQDGG